MSYDFLGTFNKAQFERFAAFARSQLGLAQDRLTHLNAEILRVGSIVFSYDQGGVPFGYVPDPPDSYIGKLVAVYEILGGNANLDLNVRARTQPVYLLKGSETVNPQVFSNGEVMGAPGLADAPSSVLIQGSRAWLNDTLQYRRDYLERKIRRMIDYSDRLQQEINLLQVITQDDTVEGSLESMFKLVEELVNDKTYRATSTGTDPFNKAGYAPMAGYTPGPNREADDISRGLDGGVSVPGSNTSNMGGATG